MLTPQKLKKDHVDVLWVEDEKLGVEQAKKIRQHLSLKPYSTKGRVVVVLNTHLMTPDAQNSLLKTLEEPPQEAIILLGADSDKNILPTILSRVQTIFLEKTNDYKLQTTEKKENTAVDSGRWTADIERLLSNSIEQRFEFIEKLEDKEAFLKALLEYFHSNLPEHHKYSEFSKELMKAEEWVGANGNLRAILEYLMLRMPF